MLKVIVKQISYTWAQAHLIYAVLSTPFKLHHCFISLNILYARKVLQSSSVEAILYTAGPFPQMLLAEMEQL